MRMTTTRSWVKPRTAFTLFVVRFQRRPLLAPCALGNPYSFHQGKVVADYFPSLIALPKFTAFPGRFAPLVFGLSCSCSRSRSGHGLVRRSRRLRSNRGLARGAGVGRPRGSFVRG